MTRFTLLPIGLLLALVFAAPETHAYSAEVAETDCRRDIKNNGRYSGFRNVEAEDQGHNSFKITGTVEDSHNGKRHGFTCKIRHKEVTSWKVSDEKDHSDAKIGAGVLGLAVAAALVAESADDHHGGGDPFDDMKSLKHECKQELEAHIGADHGTVRNLKIHDVHLRNRVLTGDGHVELVKGKEHDLSFTCDFDRHGRVRDGNYHYR